MIHNDLADFSRERVHDVDIIFFPFLNILDIHTINKATY